MALHPKVTAAMVAGAIVGLLVAEAKRRGVPIEPDEAVDLNVLISFAVAFWVPSNGNENGAPVQPPPAPFPPAGIGP